MEKHIKRVAAIHDMSGFGKTSLTAIIPILSTMRIQVCPLPTAILSTHTGGFDNYTFVDLTDTMEAYIKHWKDLNLEFDSIYSGFLGSNRQIEIVEEFIDKFKKQDTLVVVDPVLADNGELYSTMNDEMVKNMRQLIKKAQIITPNFTEMALLLDKEYNRNISTEELKLWLKELSDMGPEVVIGTSMPEDKDEKFTSVIAYDKRHDKYWKVSCAFIPAHYPGTGDIFSSVIVGSLLNGESIPVAIDRAVQFVNSAIKASYGFDYPEREGVLLENVLNNLNMPVYMNSYQLL
ncbi:pyridoxamine kinase [Clostridium sp. HMP27]|uniref:pyridoxamine kinase n=1 Tax=Clostridium sp. HMP27 TaxID=1487921 RepID=UPI00052B669D|nr:pyridoxamine kinase [Clostridium sp. HMP27]KGK87626.1 pyridoxamine kinase [Clostridium sp. HMP27]